MADIESRLQGRPVRVREDQILIPTVAGAELLPKGVLLLTMRIEHRYCRLGQRESAAAPPSLVDLNSTPLRV